MIRIITAAIAVTALGLGAWRLYDDPRSPITGEARVIDGDTLDIGGTRVRLEGIDAPELAQDCGDSAGGSYPCGEAAKAALTRLTHGKRISCEPTGNDRYHRMLAVCREEANLDINSEMVRLGEAVAFRRYSTRYVKVENEARAARRGVWGRPLPGSRLLARHEGWPRVPRPPSGILIT